MGVAKLILASVYEIPVSSYGRKQKGSTGGGHFAVETLTVPVWRQIRGQAEGKGCHSYSLCGNEEFKSHSPARSLAGAGVDNKRLVRD